MKLLFISISIIILIIVIIVAAKPIIAGIKAKSEFNEEKKNECGHSCATNDQWA